MLLCQHRVNSLDALANTPRHLGVEVDIRSDGEILYIAHDPFVDGLNFEEWLDSYEHSFLIANVKEEGLEEKLRGMFSARGIENWAFLDQSFPFLVKEIRQGFTRTMVRISEFESKETALNFNIKPEWVWLDSFTGAYPPPDVISELSDAGYKFMLVSPELQGRKPGPEIAKINELFSVAKVTIDGVCTKVPELWI